VEKKQVDMTISRNFRGKQNNKRCNSDPRQTTNQIRMNEQNQWATGQGSGFRLRCFKCGEVGHCILILANIAN
jgi:hypothetical protein